MASNLIKKTENEVNHENVLKLPHEIGTDYNFKRKIVWWPNVIGFAILHLGGLYGIYLFFHCYLSTFLWSVLIAYISGFGVTIGAHRLYTHKSFKAKWPLKLALVMAQCVAGQNCLYIWVRDHRQHHKYSDTDADPHNSNRGFFFAHIGWLLSKKHPLVISKGKQIDMSDLEADPIACFQRKYYKSIYLIFAIILPVVVPMYFWNETFKHSIFCAYFARYTLLLNFAWCVNSVAHIYGTKPFTKNMNPVESYFTSFVALGEGWHNYHHTFPYDYRAAEAGTELNLGEKLINLFHWLGLAYDLKVAPKSTIEYRVRKYGDGTHKLYGNDCNGNVSKFTFDSGKEKYLQQNIINYQT